MVERDLYVPFSHFIKDTWKPNGHGSGVFELKICKSDRLSFKELREGQERTLKMTAGPGMYHKIADDSRGTKPFDSMFLCNIPAYVVICFYKPRKYPTYIIPIESWISFKESKFERKERGCMSVTEEECKRIATMITEL